MLSIVECLLSICVIERSSRRGQNRQSRWGDKLIYSVETARNFWIAPPNWLLAFLKFKAVNCFEVSIFKWSRQQHIDTDNKHPSSTTFICSPRNHLQANEQFRQFRHRSSNSCMFDTQLRYSRQNDSCKLFRKQCARSNSTRIFKQSVRPKKSVASISLQHILISEDLV